MSDATLGLDPGTTHTGWVIIGSRGPKYPIIACGKDPNELLIQWIIGHDPNDGGPFSRVTRATIERFRPYGQRLGDESIMTVWWSGRFDQAIRMSYGIVPTMLTRRDVLRYIVDAYKGTDADVTKCLIDRYGPGRRAAVGLKGSPGPLYTLKGKDDAWQALGLAVTFKETC